MIRCLVLISVIWAMPALLSLNCLDGFVQAASQEKKKTRRVPALRESTYKRLSQAQVMIDPESIPRAEGEPAPEPTGTPQEAVEMLTDYLDKRGLNSYEKAQIWYTIAFAYYTLDDMGGTIRAYEQVLGQGLISEALEQSTLRALFQLYFGEENYVKAIEFIERYEAATGTLDAVVTFTKALAYYLLENLPKSLENALLVEQIVMERGQEMREPWWYLQVVLYNQLEDVDNTIAVLETLILNFPKKQYWMHLAGMYSEKEWEDLSLSAYHACYVQGFLIRETEIVMLSQRLLAAQVPYEAAAILEQGFKDEVVKRNEKNLKLLATAYTMAQEMPDAITAWGAASDYATDGDIFYRLAQAQAREEQFRDAVKSYKKAIKFGDLTNPGDVYFWLAIAQMNLEDWNGASKSFRSSGKADKRKSKAVNQYIRYIAGEKRRQKELKKMAEGAD